MNRMGGRKDGRHVSMVERQDKEGKKNGSKC